MRGTVGNLCVEGRTSIPAIANLVQPQIGSPFSPGSRCVCGCSAVPSPLLSRIFQAFILIELEHQKPRKHLLTASYSLLGRQSCRISAYASSIGLFQSFGYQTGGYKDPSFVQISFLVCASSHALFYPQHPFCSSSKSNAFGSLFAVDVFEMQLPSPTFFYIHPIPTGQVHGLTLVSVHLNTNVCYRRVRYHISDSI